MRDQETGGSPLWRTRLRGARIDVSETHDDFPQLLAESLDLHQQLDGRLPEVAAALGTTVSQLTKLWKKAPEALLLVNEDRTRRGLRPLE